MLRSQWAFYLGLRPLSNFRPRCLQVQQTRAAGSIPPTKRTIATLDPRLIQAEDFINISGILRIGFHYGNAHLQDVAYDKTGGTRFPDDSTGFFYYHNPPSHLPPTAGGIRFRVCKEFSAKGIREAYDLLKPEGVPFEISLWQLSVKKSFWDELVQDRVVTRGLLEFCARLLDTKTKSPHTIISGLRQPFALNLTGNTVLHFVRKESLHKHVYRTPFANDFVVKTNKTVVAHFDYDEEQDEVFLQVLKPSPGVKSIASFQERFPLNRQTSSSRIAANTLLEMRNWSKVLPPSVTGH
ncbi:hypothetical protein K435DRAFT_966672 [Dendrothele bispora CBS 962.96]|uniref:Uncharacterized protein n=1 Tax=Dendrothele bispora (strain CBS 962.96) TaxID=1314807 RepID=A0A4S8M047_DENBC|nr:hypothetical protein K435DRAFT_966672 [Dendrothele bispora CBS 962.96]